MAVDTLDVDKQSIGGPNVGSPSSGTYGEKQAQTNLQKSLPQSQADAGGAPPGAPPMANQEPITPTPDRAGRPALGAPGVPPALTRPSAMPEVPVNTPLQGPAIGPQVTPVDNHFESRLQMLDTLAENPRVSPQTREWAQTVRAILIGGDPV